MKLVKIQVITNVQDSYTLFAETPYSAANIIQSALENGKTQINIWEANSEEIVEWQKNNRLEVY